MKKYYVSKTDETGESSVTKGFAKFNKKEIAHLFVGLCKCSEEGDEIEYYQSDNKYGYISMLTVKKRNGELKRQVVKGNNVYYKIFNLKELF